MGELEHLIAVDVGNSRVKLGLFECATQCEQAAQAALLPIASGLPDPIDCLEVDHSPEGQLPSEPIANWLARCAARRAVVASVHQAAGAEIVRLLTGSGVSGVSQLSSADLPLVTRVDQPERVGIDRLLGAVAANRLRRAGAPAIVIDVGTAITIDLVAPDGAFEGGAILPGIRMASRALEQQTDALPDVAMDRLEESPDAVGKSTIEALRAGLFWGSVGAVREVVARQRDRLTQPPQLYLTGGAAPSIARLLAEPDCTVRYLPHLVLAGAAIAAESPS